jgi:DNA-binding NarL/FixJ family response regulator
MIKVGIIEDDEFIRNTFVSYLSDQEEFEVVLARDSVEGFLADITPDTAPEVLLLDIHLPGMTGIEGIALLKEYLPKVEITMITVFTDPEHIFKALCAGANGYLVKNTPLPQLKEHILQLKQGGAAITPSIARKVIDYFNPRKSNFKESLSEREADVIKGIVDGLSYKLIADRLSVSINTVREYVKRIYRKLQINSKAELISQYHRGLI